MARNPRQAGAAEDLYHGALEAVAKIKGLVTKRQDMKRLGIVFTRRVSATVPLCDRNGSALILSQKQNIQLPRDGSRQVADPAAYRVACVPCLTASCGYWFTSLAAM